MNLFAFAIASLLLVEADLSSAQTTSETVAPDPCAYASLLYDNRPDGCPEHSTCQLIPDGYVFKDTLNDQFMAQYACFCGDGFTNKPINHNAGCDEIESECINNVQCGTNAFCSGGTCSCISGFINTGVGIFACTVAPPVCSGSLADMSFSAETVLVSFLGTTANVGTVNGALTLVGNGLSGTATITLLDGTSVVFTFTETTTPVGTTTTGGVTTTIDLLQGLTPEVLVNDVLTSLAASSLTFDLATATTATGVAALSDSQKIMLGLNALVNTFDWLCNVKAVTGRRRNLHGEGRALQTSFESFIVSVSIISLSQQVGGVTSEQYVAICSGTASSGGVAVSCSVGNDVAAVFNSAQSSSGVPAPAPPETPAPPAPGPSPVNRTRLLAIEKVDNENDLKILLDDKNPCESVKYGLGWTLEERKMCLEFTSQELIIPECKDDKGIVPMIYHSIGKTSEPTFAAVANSRSNPDFQRNYLEEGEAAAYIREKCGEEVAMAYECMAAPSSRADIFRFCALYADGGVYVDDNFIPLVPFEKLYSSCASASIGFDIPKKDNDKWLNAKQSKIASAAPGAPIFKCALDSIVQNGRDQSFWVNVTVPVMLSNCYDKHPQDVAVTYMDTMGASWPFTGIRRGNTTLAYDMPHGKESSNVDESKVYEDYCALWNVDGQTSSKN